MSGRDRMGSEGPTRFGRIPEAGVKEWGLLAGTVRKSRVKRKRLPRERERRLGRKARGCCAEESKDWSGRRGVPCEGEQRSERRRERPTGERGKRRERVCVAGNIPITAPLCYPPFPPQGGGAAPGSGGRVRDGRRRSASRRPTVSPMPAQSCPPTLECFQASVFRVWG